MDRCLTRNRRKIDSGISAELGAGWRLNFARQEKLFLNYIYEKIMALFAGHRGNVGGNVRLLGRTRPLSRRRQ